MAPTTAVVLVPPLRQQVHWTDRVGNLMLLGTVALLCIGLIAPLLLILSKALDAPEGDAVSGLGAFGAYLASPALLQSLWHSVWVSVLVTVIVVPLAFTFAYALTRSCMPFKPLFRTITLLPLLAPSLLSAISLIYWFGNQGIAKDFWLALGFTGIYGAPGIVLAECFAAFPHVLMILVTALTLADARLYEAADALGTSTLRKFFTITLPGAKYGLISGAMVCFTLVITDFGIPKVVGGNFNVLATDVFKLVIGQQDFQRGAVVALLLLAPAVLTFGVDYLVQRKQTATLTARAVALVPKRAKAFDTAMTLYCVLIVALMLAMFFMAVFASFATLWPYNLAPSFNHYVSGLVDAELGDAMLNSLKLAACTAVIGTVIVFIGAYLLEKTRGFDWARPLVRLMAMLPMAVPGLVLGLGYIFFFNAPSNPLNVMYQTLPLLVLCTIIHFYTTGHLTMVTALKSIDAEFEAVSASLKVPFYTTFWRVTLPICLPTLLDVSRYFFINAMTTISAVVFLYSPDTKLASVAILNLDEAGDTGPAAAMAVLIAATSAVVTLLYLALGKWVDRHTQRWRAPGR
ncbi:putative 2-aminoethylphosphonate ABC transporter permease subunit [Variovorax sp. J22G21]|uniref:putative 2-aminoethylphosphonate ABC transporter permease subunit n=1 Tax=Variovorax fucosicus TaxID=3053517 RepID=UPI002574B1A5|nr:MULTISPECIES: putative 2-aminoethylphosphonate ABC transporter permease subunit [unclassified Variovorax]MDM0041056.1 putative 2-aminoethylphosphonate ABC transporter permease subunit [Variovorax sp. J22R193]MDM0060113.1 putative 2-aminoethylphosphonate ABC transporter permease subunit [Variovorax sp. J22G21]